MSRANTIDQTTPSATRLGGREQSGDLVSELSRKESVVMEGLRCGYFPDDDPADAEPSPPIAVRFPATHEWPTPPVKHLVTDGEEALGADLGDGDKNVVKLATVVLVCGTFRHDIGPGWIT